MKPELIDWHCSDIENIEKWQPPDPSYVDLWVEFTIGCDQIAGDIFAAHVVTPNALKNTKDKKHIIVLNLYSWDELMIELEKILHECSDYDWKDICYKLSKRMHWEYEGVIPPHQNW